MRKYSLKAGVLTWNPFAQASKWGKTQGWPAAGEQHKADPALPVEGARNLTHTGQSSPRSPNSTGTVHRPKATPKCKYRQGPRKGTVFQPSSKRGRPSRYSFPSVFFLKPSHFMISMTGTVRQNKMSKTARSLQWESHSRWEPLQGQVS